MKLQSADVLRAHMAHKQFGSRRLARYCGLAGSGMIDHLLAGRRNSCSPKLAHDIAEALDVPLEALFVPVVPSATRSTAKSRKVAA